MPSSALPKITNHEAEQVVFAEWSDDHQVRFDYKYLRCHCACDECIDEKTGIRVLDPDSIDPEIRVQSLEMVGDYAIKLSFSDGHSDTQYSLSYLKRLCPCSACGGPEPYDRRESPQGLGPL